MTSRYLDKWVVSTSWEIIKRQLTLKSRWGRQDRVIGIVANQPGVLKQTRSLLALKMQSQYGLGTQYSGKILKSGFVYRISSFKKFITITYCFSSTNINRPCHVVTILASLSVTQWPNTVCWQLKTTSTFQTALDIYIFISPETVNNFITFLKHPTALV